jgi:hypothetical protein
MEAFAVSRTTSSSDTRDADHRDRGTSGQDARGAPWRPKPDERTSVENFGAHARRADRTLGFEITPEAYDPRARMTCECCAPFRRTVAVQPRDSGTRVTCLRAGCRGLLWRVRVGVGRRVRIGVGRRGGLAAERRRTTLTGRAERLVGGGGVGAPSVTSVLDERGVVGDNNRIWVSPLVGARSRHCSEAVQHECWRATRLGS